MIETINPATGKMIGRYEPFGSERVASMIENAQTAFSSWSCLPIETRGAHLVKLADCLIQNRRACAEQITIEMGKPIAAAEQEIDKCAWACRYFAKKGPQYLESRFVETQASKSYVTYNPLGVIFCIMPWNFPYWQVIRFAAANLILGNTILLKSAPITTGCGLQLVEWAKTAGFPSGVLQALVIEIDAVETVLSHPAVQGVTITGSTRAGQAVAAQAGASLKKSVTELGGNDACLILEDNDEKALKQAAQTCVRQRMLVSGQVCVSPKRLVVVESVRAQFEAYLAEALTDYIPGDPMSADCLLGPCAREDLRGRLHDQVNATIGAGAQCVMGGAIPAGPGFYYPATMLTDVPVGSPAYREELFGPVVAVIAVRDEAEAIAVANDSIYGLGASVYTQNIERGEEIARYALLAGTCTVNVPVTSDPRLPFGGVKQSGYGRELGVAGLLEFANIKTIWVL